MTLSSFHVCSQRGHLDRAKCIFGYIRKFNNATIRVRTNILDYSGLPEHYIDWYTSVQGTCKEVLPFDAPVSLGRPVLSTTYVDANLMHNLLLGKWNKTPIDWYSKKHATFETATFGSEYVTAITAVEQIIDLCTTLQYLDVAVCNHSYLFSNNNSILGSSTAPDTKLSKRHVIFLSIKLEKRLHQEWLDFTSSVAIPTLQISWANIGLMPLWQQLRMFLHWKWNITDLFT